MKIPTIAEFNNWTHRAKHRWIELETYGKYKRLSRANGYFPLIIYAECDVAIVYQVDQKGNLIETKAMTIKEALDRLVRFHEASKAVMSTN